jgi:hypothetical protein
MHALLLIGSRAAAASGISIARKPADFDFIVAPFALSQLKAFLKDITARSLFIDKRRLALCLTTGDVVELELAWPDSSAEKLLAIVSKEADVQVGPHTITTAIASPNVQLALKLSHRYRKDSPHFLKTMDDIYLLRAGGASIAGLEDIIKLRETETYGYQHPNLKRTKKDFFSDDGIKYVYDHDSIHETVAHLDKPAYRFFSTDGEEVFSSREKFSALDERIKLFAVLEESYVLALERSQIPFRGQVTPRASFNIALMKVCSSITSGWFREYAWEHFHQAQALYDDSYAERFFKAADTGEVKLFNRA